MKMKLKKNISLENSSKYTVIEGNSETQKECVKTTGSDLCYEIKQRAEVVNYSRKSKIANLKPIITCSKCAACKFQDYSVTAELAYVYMLLSENIANEEILAILRNKYDWSEIDATINKKKILAREKAQQELQREIEFRKSNNYEPCETYLWAK